MRALVRAPDKAIQGAPALLGALRTSLNSAFGKLRRVVIEREVTTKRAVGHLKHDFAHLIRRTHLRGGVQQWIEHRTSADQERRRKKHEKQR